MNQDLLKARYRQLLGYIAELDRLRTPRVNNAGAHDDAIDLSGIPQHPSVTWNLGDPTAFLVVTRCEIPPSPLLPASLEGYVQYTPNEIDTEPYWQETKRSEEDESLTEDFNITGDWEVWHSSWRDWAEVAHSSKMARDLYVRLYDLRSKIEQHSDKYELVVADVSVAFQAADHPILINPVRLEFDVDRSRITVGCLDEPTQVYGDAIRDAAPRVAESIVNARKEVLENPDIWALGGDAVDQLATRFVQAADPNGTFIKGLPPSDRISARRHPWILLRRRSTGLIELAEGLISKFDEDGLVPIPIQPVLVDREEFVQTDLHFLGEPDEDNNVFFTKPANAEQLAILRHFKHQGCVHVQGPPGTGKTHTIANLIGHFLAEGKTVLVTSEKAQALSVLRDKVVEELRPLCVSLAGTGTGEGLKAGITGLVEKLTSTEPSRLALEIERLRSGRTRTIEALRQARKTMRDIIENEHMPIELSGWRGSPTAAAKYVFQHRSTLGWIPGTLSSDSEPPLTTSEFNELLDLLSQYSDDAAFEVRKPLPPPTDVLSPEEFRTLLEDIERCTTLAPAQPALKVPYILEQDFEFVESHDLLEKIEIAISSYYDLDEKYRELANRFVETDSLLTAWETWTKRALELLEREHQVRFDAAPYEFGVKGEAHNVLPCAKSLFEHVSRTGRAITKPRLMNRQDKLLFQTVSSKRPLGDMQSLQALIQQLEFDEHRHRFRVQIQAAAQSIGFTDYGNGEPERFLVRDSLLKTALKWKFEYFDAIESRMRVFGVDFERTESSIPGKKALDGPIDQRVWWLEHVARPVVLSYLHSKQFNELLDAKELLDRRALSWTAGDPSGPLRSIADAILASDLPAYHDAYFELDELRSAAEPVKRRDVLLERIRSLAQQFATSLENGSFDSAGAQGTLGDAWTYALINQELMRRNALSLEDAKSELERLKRQLDQTTVNLANALAWAAQHERVTQPVRSALSRYHQAQKKIGRGKDNNDKVIALRRAMRNAMQEAKDAFPVWIMPLYEVAKSFDFTKTRFDVVIVDESSQLSAVGLITLLIADSAIVVGDDEQTEPSLIGERTETITNLIREHLVDFTDRILWSPDSSLYSFAARFGTTVALREHFRCVPQIISFSSRLCYQCKIQALRESRGVAQIPHVVPILCREALDVTEPGLNESEANEIVSLLIACFEQPEYQGQTFGVISLRGSESRAGNDRQTEAISKRLREALDAEKYEKLMTMTKLKFGVPSSFQGDERDVIFISVFDSPVEGPLKLLPEDSIPGSNYKKRLNVAVSRARNQVWVVHSFSHFEAELKENDIRRKLFEFAYAPEQWLESTRAENPKAESPFEEDVYKDLVRRGYSLTSQVPVGHYRIDLVAEDNDARVAIECDGDAYHQDAAADLARQIVLERCGWRFVRIRGSEYYRDPEGAIGRVVKELARCGVNPTHAQPDQVEPDGSLLQRVRQRAKEIHATLSEAKPKEVNIKECLGTNVYSKVSNETPRNIGPENNEFDIEGDRMRVEPKTMGLFDLE